MQVTDDLGPCKGSSTAGADDAVELLAFAGELDLPVLHGLGKIMVQALADTEDAPVHSQCGFDVLAEVQVQLLFLAERQLHQATGLGLEHLVVIHVEQAAELLQVSLQQLPPLASARMKRWLAGRT